MKRFAFAAFAFLLAGSASAQMSGMGMKDDMKGMDMKSDKGTSQTHEASGTVKKVDAAKSTVTVAHGPVPSLKWPAMTMTFKAKDKTVLDKAKQGEKIEFEFVQRGQDYVITSVK